MREHEEHSEPYREFPRQQMAFEWGDAWEEKNRAVTRRLAEGEDGDKDKDEHHTTAMRFFLGGGSLDWETQIHRVDVQRVLAQVQRPGAVRQEASLRAHTRGETVPSLLRPGVRAGRQRGRPTEQPRRMRSSNSSSKTWPRARGSWARTARRFHLPSA